jgi:hypothetical protein
MKVISKARFFLGKAEIVSGTGIKNRAAPSNHQLRHSAAVKTTQ